MAKKGPYTDSGLERLPFLVWNWIHGSYCQMYKRERNEKERRNARKNLEEKQEDEKHELAFF